MTFRTRTNYILGASAVLALLAAAPALTPAQQKPPIPAPKAPAAAPKPAPKPPAARPAQQPARPAQQQARPAPQAQTQARAPQPNGRPGAPQTPQTPQANAPRNTLQQQNNRNLPNQAKGGPGTPGKPGTPAGNPANSPGGRTPSVSNAKTPGVPGRPGATGNPGTGGRSAPVKQVSLSNGGSARVRSNGQISSVNRNGMQIQHNLNGGRTTMSQSNGKRIATMGKNSGYVQNQKPYATGKNGQAYYSRTSYNNGQASTGTYVGFNFGGQQYFGYQPQSFYSPAFYGWASDPWDGQIAFGVDAWGWGGAPWLGYYGFTPYAYYAGPAYWLTDYVLAAELQAAYGEVGVAPVATVSPAIPVIANRPWTDTGMAVAQGQTYTISATGVINYNPRAVSSPNGVDCGGSNGLQAPQFPCISMLGRIGPYGAPFFIGSQTSLTAPFTGELFLGVNDGYFADNSGAWIATVVQEGAVEVATAPPQPAYPPSMQVCEQGGCATWVWDGAHYNANWSNGAISILTVVKWDSQGVIISRVDPAGASAGNIATYTGRILGPNAIGGAIAGNMRGNPWAETFTATSPTPVLVAAVAAPAPAYAAPARAAAPAGGSDTVALTPDVKEAIAGEVKATLAAENAAAQGTATPAPSDGPPPALDPARRTFIVATDLTVTVDGQECSLTPGDVLTRLGDRPDENQDVNTSISSSKRYDCPQGEQVSISLNDLQEMRNQFEQKLDSGLKTLASKQGTKLPKAPNTSTVASGVPAPPPDPAAAKELQQQQAAADQTEAQVKQEVSSGSSPGGN